MAEAVAYPVEVKADFVARQTKAQPVAALAELIWNALDADATRVDVELDYDALGGLSAVVVSDNGHGMPHAEAPTLFRSLGGSWKKHGARTKELGRALHGQEGRGRFKALALGRLVEWKVVAETEGGLSTYTVQISEDDVNQVRITEPETISGARRGVTVVIHDAKRNFTSLKPENAVQELSEALALYLKNYRDIRVSIAGEVVDPQRRLINKTDRIAIGIKTWGELLDENNARFQFIQEQLQHSATDEQALAHLRERHRQFLEGVIIDDEADEVPSADSAANEDGSEAA